MQRNVVRLGILAVMALGLTAGAAPAQEYDHIDKLARRVEKQAKVIHAEADKHFPKATALHRHARDVEKLGTHLHELAHEKGQLRHMRDDLKKMDALIHDMEKHIDALRPLNDEGRRALKHVREALADLHESVKHLQKHLK